MLNPPGLSGEPSNHEKSIIEKYIYMKIMKPASMRVEAGFVVD